MAHISSEDGEPLYLAYAPVSFENGVADFDRLLGASKSLHLFIAVVLVCGGFALLAWAGLKWSMYSSQRNFERDVAANGISMRTMPGKFSGLANQSTQQSSTDQSIEATNPSEIKDTE